MKDIACCSIILFFTIVFWLGRECILSRQSIKPVIIIGVIYIVLITIIMILFAIL